VAGYHPFWVQMGEWMVVEWRDPRGLWIVRQSTVVGGRNSIVVRDRNDLQSMENGMDKSPPTYILNPPKRKSSAAYRMRSKPSVCPRTRGVIRTYMDEGIAKVPSPITVSIAAPQPSGSDNLL